MGGVADFLFGKTEDAKQVGQAETLTPGQKQLLDSLTTMLGGQLGKGVNPYPGQTVAGPTSNQLNVFDMVKGITSGQDMMGLDALTGPFDPKATTDFFNTNVKAPAIENWESDIIPKIQEHYIGMNAGSSGAGNRAIATSGADLESSLGRSLSQMLYGAKSQHEQQLPDILQQILGMGTGAGSLERGINQQQLTGDYNSWMSSQPYNNPWLNSLSTALGTTAFQPIVQGPSSQSGILKDLAPGLGTFLAGI